MELREKLEEYQAYFAARGLRGDENLAREYGQVYDRVEELFERLTGLLGDEKAERKSYAQILDAGFGEIQVGVIPATIDQVMVGDITRTRLDGVQVLFFVGVNDGVVPQRKNGGQPVGRPGPGIFQSASPGAGSHGPGRTAVCRNFTCISCSPSPPGVW